MRWKHFSCRSVAPPISIWRRITFRDPSVETGKGLFVNGGGNPNFGGRCAGVI